MKIHSDTLTFQDIQAAVPDGCYLPVFDHPGFGRTRCAYEASRTHARGFIVRLCGSSRYAPRNLPGEKSATYDEWGYFIAALFSKDENAKIGVYKDADTFHSMTDGKFPLVAA